MNAIKIENLNKSYDGFSLDNINLSIPQGTIVGLVGQNGAGKTTIIKLILNMIKRNSGTITVLGKDNREDDFVNVKEDIGIVLGEMGIAGFMQGKQIDKMMQNIYKNWDSELFKEYLKKFDVPYDKEFKNMSKGMKVKAGIAVALSHKPKLLILDEATSGLDPIARDEILDIFIDFTRDENHTVLISSHIVSDLEKACDYIAFIRKGSLLLFEEKDSLRENYKVAHMSLEEYECLDKSLIKGKKLTQYGAEVLMKKEDISNGVNTSHISIEDLFILMSKEV